jgi:hypothetical protein
MFLFYTTSNTGTATVETHNIIATLVPHVQDLGSLSGKKP